MGTIIFTRIVRYLAPGIIAMTLAAPVLAAEPASSLTGLIEQALRNNGDLAAFRAEKMMRDAGTVRAGLLPNPTLDLEGVTGSLTGSRDESTFSVGLSQEVYLAGQRGKRLAVAQRELELYRWHLAERERLLREEVSTAYYDALLAQQRVELAERAVALNRQLLDVAAERLAAGDIPELELNLVKVELARSKGTRIESARALVQARSRLRALGASAAGPSLSGTLAAAPGMTRGLDELQRLARSNRPDLKALETEIVRDDADLTLAEALRIPNLTVGVGYSHQERADKTGVGEEVVRDNVLGLRFSLPLPVFDRNQGGIQEARARRTRDESRLLSAEGSVRREVETAYAAHGDALEIVALYTADILPQFEENLKLTREAYRLGEVGILAVIQEQKKFFEINDGYLTALHGRQTALAKLEAVTATELTGGGK